MRRLRALGTPAEQEECEDHPSRRTWQTVNHVGSARNWHIPRRDTSLLDSKDPAEGHRDELAADERTETVSDGVEHEQDALLPIRGS